MVNVLQVVMYTNGYEEECVNKEALIIG